MAAALGHRVPPAPQSREHGCHQLGLFDFAHKEVRDHKMAIIEEFITRWDNDGIALDFDRDPRYFKEFGVAENAAHIMDNFTWITYPMPPDVFRLGQNELKIDIKRLNPAICVTPWLDHVGILVQ